MSPRKKPPAKRSPPMLRPWRAQGMTTVVKPTDTFDEVVVGDWFHFEAMGPSHVWGRIGPLNVNVTRTGGVLRIRIDGDQDDGKSYEVIVDGDIARAAPVKGTK